MIFALPVEKPLRYFLKAIVQQERLNELHVERFITVLLSEVE